MTTTTRIQLRGICQCCGRQQAVVSGFMSKHGYTVEHGWFDGVCTGQHFKPMQHDRTQADIIVSEVREECAKLLAKAAAIRAGTIKPLMAKSGKRIKSADPKGFPWEDELVNFADAPAHYQRQAVETAAWNAQRRAEVGESFAASLERIADEYHGKPLLEVPMEEGPEPIKHSEKRRAPSGRVVTVTDVSRGRVSWKDEKGFKSWTGVQAFRKFEKVQG